MQETVYFDLDNLSMLVVDEADELLSMGFENTLNTILKQLPKKRQSILLSATLGKDVLKLARFALNVTKFKNNILFYSII